jgi:CNT family concentrative nucleoside transporter
MLQLQSFLGFFVFLGVAYLCSVEKQKVSWRLVASGVGLQLALALLVLGVPALGIHGPLQFLFELANQGILSLLAFTEQGSAFIFGDLVRPDKIGLIIAFQVLPIIIFLSSLMTLLYHMGLMQWVVNGFASVMQNTLKLSGAESLAAAANVFVGQTEAPLVVRPYLNTMTRSELFCLMTGGMATIAGSVMAAYVGILKDIIPGIGGHLLTASVLSAPAALVVAKIMVPETQTPETLGHIPKNSKKQYVNVIEAAAAGATEGMKLAANVAAMLLAFVAIIALGDALITGLGVLLYNILDFFSALFVAPGQTLTDLWNGHPLHSIAPSDRMVATWPAINLSLILSGLFMPVAYFLGLPLSDLSIAGSLIGKKIVFNEFIAYLDLAQQGGALTPRSQVVLSYALCGFANFSSIAIQIGGIGPLAPSRKTELAQLGIRSVIGGSLAAFLTACMASVLL